MPLTLAGRLRSRVRQLQYAIRFFGRPVHIHRSSRVDARSDIQVRMGGSIAIGEQCEIHATAMILTYGGNIQVGNHCSINPYCVLYGHGGLRIGDGVRIASHTVIIPANHSMPEDGTPVRSAPVSARGIEIGDNVWIGAGARILDGVTIGANSVIGAGSVVTRSVAANVTVAGVPARVIGTR